MGSSSGEATLLVNKTLTFSNYNLSLELKKRGYEKESEKIAKCCKDFIILRCNKRIYRVPSNPCKYRICPVCANTRISKFKKRYWKVINSFNLPGAYNHRGLRLVTFSLRNMKSQEEGINAIRKAFHKLRVSNISK